MTIQSTIVRARSVRPYADAPHFSSKKGGADVAVESVLACVRPEGVALAFVVGFGADLRFVGMGGCVGIGGGEGEGEDRECEEGKEGEEERGQLHGWLSGFGGYLWTWT